MSVRSGHRHDELCSHCIALQIAGPALATDVELNHLNCIKQRALCRRMGNAPSTALAKVCGLMALPLAGIESNMAYTSVAPMTASSPQREQVGSKIEADLLKPDVHDPEHGTCWALKQALKKEFVFSNIQAWVDGPYFWKDQCCIWQGLCCGPVCGWPCLALYFYVPARLKGNLDILIKQAEISEEQEKAK